MGASKIPILIRIFKQKASSLRLRVILTGLLVMTLTVSTEAIHHQTGSGETGIGSNLYPSPSCARYMETQYSLVGVPWSNAFSGQMWPDDFPRATLNFSYNGGLSQETLDYAKSTDSPMARHRALSATSIASYDNSGDRIASIYTPLFGDSLPVDTWSGNFFDGARLYEIAPEVHNAITDNPPSHYIGFGAGYLYRGRDYKPDPILQAAKDLPDVDLLGYGAVPRPPGMGSYGLELAQGHEVINRELWEVDEESGLIKMRISQKPSFYSRISRIIESPKRGGIEDYEWEPSDFWVAFKEPIILRFGEDTNQVVPNDPLFAKKESELKKAASGLTKAFGSVLKLGGSGITVGESPGESTKPPNQWGLFKVGYTPRSDPQSAWNIEDGSRKNVVVAVIDSGLDLKHVDGPQFLWTNPGEIPDNNIDDDANGYVDDIHGWNFVDESNNLTDDFGHGTFVTGIIAAKTNNGEGIAGINPGAQIMTLKALSKGNKASSLAIYRAIRYAVDNGARVINISLGGKGISRLEQIGINYAYAQGCLVVSSSGNNGSDVAEYGPQGLRRVFSVAAVNVDGKRRGSANHGANVAMTAPGEHIYSLTAKDGKKDGQITPILGTTYHTLTGTSFSAPMVAGTASLIWAKNPNLTNRQVEDMLLNSAEDLDRKGWDRYNGAGLLNASKALSAGEGDRLTVRFTEVFANEEKKKIASLDVYGIVRGNLDSYVVELGKGKKPDKWVQVFGPSNEFAEFSHICRIENDLLKKGREWTVRISAKSKSGETKAASLFVKKK